MGEKIMIIKRDRDRLRINVRRRMKNAFSPNEYSKVVNLYDSNDISTLFEDLNLLFDAPIESAFRKFVERKNKGFPF
jgi:hypothetical protein